MKNETPHYVQVAWELDALSKRHTDKLNAYKIAQAAIEIADAGGLAAATIRAIAKKTGFTTMAVYRHVESRDELLVLMAELALGPARTYDQPHWQDNVRAWSSDLLRKYVTHPWILDVQIAGMPTTPNHISWLEQSLRLLEPTALSTQEKLDTSLLIDSYMRQFASMRSGGKPTKLLSSAKPDWVMEASAESAPHFAKILQRGFLQNGVGPDMTVGLDIIISGIERRQLS